MALDLCSALSEAEDDTMENQKVYISLTAIFILTAVGDASRRDPELREFTKALRSVAEDLYTDYCTRVHEHLELQGQASDLTMWEKCDLEATQQRKHCRVPDLQTLDNHTHTRALRAVLRSVRRYEQLRDAVADDLCHRDALRNCCPNHTPLHCERTRNHRSCSSACLPESCLCHSVSDELLSRLNNMLTRLNEKVSARGNHRQLTFGDTPNIASIRGCMLAFLHQLANQMRIFDDNVLSYA